MVHALPALAGSLSTNALGTYYHATIGNQGGAGRPGANDGTRPEGAAQEDQRLGSANGSKRLPALLRSAAPEDHRFGLALFGGRLHINSSSSSCCSDSTMFIACPCSAFNSRARCRMRRSIRQDSHGVVSSASCGSTRGSGTRRLRVVPCSESPRAEAPLVPYGPPEPRRRFLLRASLFGMRRARREVPASQSSSIICERPRAAQSDVGRRDHRTAASPSAPDHLSAVDHCDTGQW